MCAVLLASIAMQPASAAPTDPLHAWVGAVTPASLKTWTDAHIAKYKSLIAKVTADSTPRTIDATFAPYDEAVGELALADSQIRLMRNVHARREIRDAAQALAQRVEEEVNTLSLNAEVYHALAAIDAAGADAATRYVLQRALLEFHLAGADRDDATRAHLHELLDAVTRNGLEFERNINESVHTVEVDHAEDLAGLPADFIASHRPGADGKIRVTSAYPDFSAVSTYARNEDLRRRAYVAYLTRAYPQNDVPLRQLLKLRHQIANLLGYPSWPDMALADLMMANSAQLQAFLNKVDEVTREPAQREYEILLKFAQSQQPGLASIDMASRFYWFEAYSRHQFNFDSQQVRPYFPYAQVESGILTATSKLFHVRFDRAPHAPVWDPSVTAWDVVDQDPQSPRYKKRIGRIYLDMHPRPGKDQWFNSDTLVPGISGRQMPEGRLVCNFPGGKAGDPGLMQYDGVVTFFHELGHLMHAVLGGQGRWASASGVATELDFVEAPSQMLEEFFHDARLLQTFARHYKTGAVLPTELIERMNRAGAFGRALGMRRQVDLAAYSYQLYAADPETVDPVELERTLIRKFNPFDPLDGVRQYASFGHLYGYSSNYYTYVVDKVIALDFFDHFDKANLVGGPVALQYRRAVLEPGGTKPAAQLISDFLGRPYNFEAFQRWLAEGLADSPAPAQSAARSGSSGS
ncbi:MAG: Zn-dependent oligopeptidase [Burkholderiaceae bacterium]|nr:Zn-dependent oligopeptidase [Burkholderiaceae bacterium]